MNLIINLKPLMRIQNLKIYFKIESEKFLIIINVNVHVLWFIYNYEETTYVCFFICLNV